MVLFLTSVTDGLEHESKGEYNIAREIYLYHSNRGDSQAKGRLGLLYLLGKGGDKKTKEGIELLKEASDHGDNSAKCNLGYCYEYGWEVEKNYNKAFNLYNESARQGNVNAQVNLGWMYYNGKGINQDREQAFKCFLQAAEHGDAYAQDVVSWMYRNGNGIFQDLEEAFYWAKRGAEGGCVISQNRLANCYREGIGTEKNPLLAFHWHKKAADAKYTVAIHSLGYCYDEGIGVNVDWKMAYELYSKANEKGFSESANNLGYMYEFGKYVQRNYDKAEAYYRQAIKLGSDVAEDNLERLLQKKNGNDSGKIEKTEEPVINKGNNQPTPTSKPNLDEVSLEQLVGLSEIKEDLINTLSIAKMQKLREKQGLKPIPMSKHLVFTGNPGTGKTTVARILAKEYKDIGILSKGQLVEVSRTDLVAKYVGQTAVKTQEKIDEAMGGILFIDEAYMLANDSAEDFGQEAIDTILKQMEDHRDEFIVIVAGYPDLMKKFIDSNPGLKSRFNKYMYFPDYSAEELIKVFDLMCQKYDLVLTPEAKEIANEYIDLMEKNKGENFANARDIRNFFERIMANQARRLSSLPNLTKSDLLKVVDSDVRPLLDKFSELPRKKKPTIGF